MARQRAAKKTVRNPNPKKSKAKLTPPADQRPILGGRRGHHSEHLGHLLAPMQYLPRTYPDARW